MSWQSSQLWQSRGHLAMSAPGPSVSRGWSPAPAHSGQTMLASDWSLVADAGLWLATRAPASPEPAGVRGTRPSLSQDADIWGRESPSLWRKVYAISGLIFSATHDWQAVSVRWSPILWWRGWYKVQTKKLKFVSIWGFMMNQMIFMVSQEIEFELECKFLFSICL